MRVSIISFGKFHAFDLARELKDKKNTIKVFSSYPFFIAKKYKIQYSEFNSFFLLQILDRIFLRRISLILKFIFAFIISIIIKKDQDIFIIWSDMPSFLLKSIKKNMPRAIIILERGSAHISAQTKLLVEEYRKFNLKYKPTPFDIEIETSNYLISDYISIPSIFSKKTFINEGIDPNKLFINPYGTDLTKFYKKNIQKDGFIFLSCGLASIQKGFHYLLQSHKYIKGDFKHYHIGKIEPKLKKNISNYPNLELFNSVSHEKLVDFYNKANILVLPSIQDGFGMVILEAMACGLPIIATKNTGFSTIDNKGLEFGFLVNIRSPEEIAEKINLFITNKNILDSYSKNSIRLILQGGFKWSDYGERYNGFLKSIKKR